MSAGGRVIPATVAAGTVLGATLAGSRFSPRQPRTAAWYARLRKPGYTPAAPAYPVAWSVLDGFLAFAGYRLLARRHARNAPLAIGAWLATVAGLTGFPAAFFGARSTEAGAAASAGMCAAAATTALAARRLDTPAAIAMTPLVAWTAFATLLSEEIWRRN